MPAMESRSPAISFILLSILLSLSHLLAALGPLKSNIMAVPSQSRPPDEKVTLEVRELATPISLSLPLSLFLRARLLQLSLSLSLFSHSRLRPFVRFMEKMNGPYFVSWKTQPPPDFPRWPWLQLHLGHAPDSTAAHEHPLRHEHILRSGSSSASTTLRTSLPPPSLLTGRPQNPHSHRPSLHSRSRRPRLDVGLPHRPRLLPEILPASTHSQAHRSQPIPCRPRLSLLASPVSLSPLFRASRELARLPLFSLPDVQGSSQLQVPSAPSRIGLFPPRLQPLASTSTSLS